MITIFFAPKPFEGHTNIIQLNAIESWTQIPEVDEIILFGNETGTSKVATKYGITHASSIKRNSYNTPLIDDIMRKAKEQSSQNILFYTNSDMIYLPNIVDTINNAISKFGDTGFVIVGRRIDVDINTRLSTSKSGRDDLEEQVAKGGRLHGYSGIDYFIYPKLLDVKLPNLAIGRPGWDTLFLSKVKKLGVPIIDASNSIKAIHQNHPPAYTYSGNEYEVNSKNLGELSRLCTIRNADYQIIKGVIARCGYFRRVYDFLTRFSIVKKLLQIKRQYSYR